MRLNSTPHFGGLYKLEGQSIALKSTLEAILQQEGHADPSTIPVYIKDGGQTVLTPDGSMAEPTYVGTGKADAEKLCYLDSQVDLYTGRD